MVTKLVEGFPRYNMFNASCCCAQRGASPTAPVLPMPFAFDKRRKVVSGCCRVTSKASFPVRVDSCTIHGERVRGVNKFPINVPSNRSIVALTELRTIYSVTCSGLPASVCCLVCRNGGVHPMLVGGPLSRTFSELFGRTSRHGNMHHFISS